MSMEERAADAEESAIPSREHGSDSSQGRAATFFSTPELRQRLDLLRHLTDNSEKILLIKGVGGSGKSTLLQQFRQLSRDEWVICCLNADHMLQPDQFFSLLFRRFGLADSAAMNIDELLKRFEMLQAAGRLPIIVIDDAHLLPVATLIALFRLFERRPGNRALIRMVLFATPEINTQFQTPQLQAMNLQSVQSLEMPLFDMAQAQAFIGFLLDLEDKQRGLKLAAGRIERIIKESAGVPGVLEAQLQSVFAVAPDRAVETVAETGRKKTIDVRTILADLPVSVLVGAPLLGLLLLLTLIFQDEINGLFDQTGTEPVAEDAAMPRVDGLRPLKLPEPGNSVEPPSTVSTPVDPPPDEMPTEIVTPIEDPGMSGLAPGEPQQEAVPLVEPKVVAPSPVAVDELVPPEVATPPADAAVTGTVTDTDAAVTATVTDTPPTEAPDPAEMPVGNEPAQPAPAESAEVGQADPPAAEAAVVEVLPEPPVSVKTTAEKSVKDEKWILTQRPGAYTLQLVGVRDGAAAKRFIDQHRLKGDVAYFKTFRSGQPWYSVVYGVYADRSAALKARETLPPALRNSDVWPRTYASIQAVVGK
ncbi:AAA family ATPase [Sedimenticola selenatireducens]|uniref:AAA family ATPase n=1 Tax=Sedimenticola selenatireducens TaxID=191960 RepID=UPI0004907248|nr:AAA family ATPase [Sedimenticola selenatireducens]